MERASIPQHLMPMMANKDSQNMQNVACTLHRGLGKIWRGLFGVRTLCVPVGVEVLFFLFFWDHGHACASGDGEGRWSG